MPTTVWATDSIQNELASRMLFSSAVKLTVSQSVLEVFWKGVDDLGAKLQNFFARTDGHINIWKIKLVAKHLFA